MLLAYQWPAVKRIPAARPRKYHALCSISKNIPDRPTRPMCSSVRVPLCPDIQRQECVFRHSQCMSISLGDRTNVTPLQISLIRVVRILIFKFLHRRWKEKEGKSSSFSAAATGCETTVRSYELVRVQTRE
jgi:hypothetical protein